MKNNSDGSSFGKILITGGTGYIGSHTCVELLLAGFDVVILDNYSNSSFKSLKNMEKITKNSIKFIDGDIRNGDLLRKIFLEFEIYSVIHFAGMKSVSESFEQPLRYYDNNVRGSLTLLGIMAEFNCNRLVFSSSATVYGTPVKGPVSERSPLNPINPYGSSKLIIENILRDLALAESGWRIATLRYFNPAGAHESGLIGENPKGHPNNLVPVIAQVAAGLREKLNIFGGDYPTRDGTGVRDYIHVVDLAKGHSKALQLIDEKPGLLTINLGTGSGCSVLEMVQTFESVSGIKIPFEIIERRPGDIAECYADVTYAKDVLNWEAKLDVRRMCEDTWRWQSMTLTEHN
jgi:UDP-glucose 4-epimerase